MYFVREKGSTRRAFVGEEQQYSESAVKEIDCQELHCSKELAFLLHTLLEHLPKLPYKWDTFHYFVCPLHIHKLVMI